MLDEQGATSQGNCRLEVEAMRHAVILLCHKDLPLVERHLRFFDGDFRFYIHIDKGANISKADVESFAARHPDAKVFRKYRVRWGSTGILKAELFLMEKILEDGGADFVHICSGQDYPIKSLSEFKDFFNENRGKQFFECHRLPYSGWGGGSMWRLDRYHPFDLFDVSTRTGKTVNRLMWSFHDKTGLRRRLPTQYPALFGGSNWMSLSGDCVRYIFEKDEYIQSFLRRMRHIFASDEVFFQTVVMNSPFAESVVPDNMRLIVWKPGSPSPEILTEKDWWRIQTSKALWARKISLPESIPLLSLIDHQGKPTETDALLFVTHFLTDSLLERFSRISKGFRSYGDAFLVHTGNVSDIEKDACARLGIRLLSIDEDDLNDLHYSPIEETIIPGSNHFIMMWFFKKLPHYRHYWNVEYDVDFSGDWENFFNLHSPRKADFLTCHVKTIGEEPGWYWWYTFRPIADIIPHEMLMKSFNPIYRISREALKALDTYLADGNEGHHEVLVPTFLNHSGFIVSDFGGVGSFVEEGFRDSAYVTVGNLPTMRYRPFVDPKCEMTQPDKLYHPVKE